MQSVLAAIADIISYLTRPFTLPQLIGYSSMFVIVAVVMLRRTRDPRRYLRRAFRTDLAYAAWFPVYTVVIGIPLSLYLAQLVTEHVPFLRLGLLANLPAWANLILWVSISDLVTYWLHRSMHQSPWLWALHKIHHSQKELNPLTTWRTHTFEFLYLNLGNFIVGLLLGNFVGYYTVVVGLLAASQFAQHSDINWTYGPIGKLVVSPRFHARHHSTAPEDLNINFGSFFIVWDHIFGTARHVADRAPGYGLAGAEDNVPESFLRQQVYPLTVWTQKIFCRTVSQVQRDASG